jgi:hypothetical protein
LVVLFGWLFGVGKLVGCLVGWLVNAFLLFGSTLCLLGPCSGIYISSAAVVYFLKWGDTVCVGGGRGGVCDCIHRRYESCGKMV